MKKIKIKWKNILLLCILQACLVLMVNDLTILFVSTLKGITIGLTWFGVITFFIALIISSILIEYFMEEME